MRYIKVRLTSSFALFLDQGQFVSISVGALQEKRRATAFEFPVRDDGDSVSQQVSLVHVVGGQQNGTAWERMELNECLWSNNF